MEVVSGGGGIHALYEDALVEILVRLPSDSVLRCRAICKSWRRVATDRSFLAARRPREMIVGTEYGFERGAAPLSLDLEPTARDDGGRRRRPYLFHPRPRAGRTSIGCFSLCASLDGLLVLKERRGHYIVCNPVTRQWTNLPALARCSITHAAWGFYFHALSGEYRLLCHGVGGGGGEEEASSESYCYVLSAGSTLPRRLMTRAPSDAPSTAWYERSPVSYRGILHWFFEQPAGTRTGKILAFDTVSETFRLMSPTPEAERPDLETMRDLLLLDGELSVATKQLLTLDIWVLQEYQQAEKWTLCHRVTLPPPTDFGLVGMPPMMGRALSAGSNAILIGSPSATMATLYDLKEIRVRSVIDYVGGFPVFMVFSESLVPHDFFHLPRCPDIVSPKFSDPFDEHAALPYTR